MPRRDFCDFCEIDCTGETSSALTLIDDADSEGNGDVTESYDIICAGCWQKIQAFLKSLTL